MEMNPNFPVDIKATITGNDENWVWDEFTKNYGSSFAAICELAKQKGYTYVYHMATTDIFFIRNDLVPPELEGIDPNLTFDAHSMHNALSLNKYDFKFWN